MNKEYLDYLKNKQKLIKPSGFDVDEKELNINLFDFQKFLVKRALQYGKYAIFSSCGTGKTVCFLDFADKVVKYTNKPVLILSPLAVSLQTIDEGKKFGIEVYPYFGQTHPGIYITNYEQVDKIDCKLFSGIVLDESGILKNFESKTKNKILEKFDKTPYKLACSATPSPNDPMELGNHAEFLNIMTRNEMLSKYFVHDSGNTSKWRLKKHSENLFWEFVAQWSIMFCTPQDIGFDDKGYILPKLNYIEEIIETESLHGFFNKKAISATNFNQELRDTMILRLNRVAEIVNKSDEFFIIWVKQNVEADYLRKLIPDMIEVRGSESIDKKENKLLGFAKKEFRVLLTKPKIGQYGLNYQHCNNQIFCSLDYSMESTYQAIRRSYRFGQEKEVNIYIITTDTMQSIIDIIKEKQNKFENMRNQLIKATLQYTTLDNKKINRQSDINYDEMNIPEWCTIYKNE